MRLYGKQQGCDAHCLKCSVHKRTKHVKVDCHLVCKNLEEKIVVAKHVSSR